MIVDELIYQIRQNLGMTPTSEQAAAMDVFARFAVSRTPQSAMIMCGSAGTGKTTLASAIVRTLEQIGRKMMLLAPTGRAAKVFALSSGHEAFTIHRKIYRQRSVDAAGGAFDLNYNRMNYTLFIVDEASMISNRQSESIFGSGRLLDDLLQFVFSGMNCKIITPYNPSNSSIDDFVHKKLRGAARSGMAAIILPLTLESVQKVKTLKEKTTAQGTTLINLSTFMNTNKE